MPHTTFSVFPVEAYQGQVEQRADVRSYRCSEDLAAGVLLELNTDGTVRAAQGTTTGLPIAGVSILQTARSSTAPLATNVTYKSGDIVPVLLRGSIWTAFNGGSPVVGAAVNVKHSSTIATFRGYATLTAANSTAGTEITALAGARCEQVNAAGDLVLLAVNLPA